MDYRNVDETLFSAVRDGLEKMATSAERTRYPKTYRAMLSMLARITSLKLSLFDLAEGENPYAFQVVYRSFCEHYLRFVYIWVRLVRENTDNVGEDFYDYFGAAELLGLAHSLEAAEAIIGIQIASDYRALIGRLFPKVNGMPRKEISAKAGQFRYRAIVQYIAKHAPAIVSRESRFLIDVIRTYAELCAFVHGGPLTDPWALKVVNGEASEDCKKAAEVIFMMSASVLMLRVSQR